MRKIKAIHYGVGAMSHMIVPYMLEKGVDVVGAIGRVSNIGKDLGDVVGLGRDLGVKVSNNAEEVLSEQEADIVIITIASFVEQIYDQIKLCVENGKNVATICEEALSPWWTSPHLTSKIDKLAKDNGVTVTGTGYQDVFWANIISLLSGGCHHIDAINGLAMYNVDDYGPEVARSHGVGLTINEFNREEEKQEIPSFMIMCVESICSAIGWTIKELIQANEPTTSKMDLYAKSLDIEIPAGNATGRKEVVEAVTNTGVKFRVELAGKVYDPDEADINKWSILGLPNIELENIKPPTDVSTCASIVNRIPDIINAEPGYVTIENLPYLKYRPYPLHFYLK
jgi:2,4-diaminopentanoate dehydrogenase